MTHITTLQYRVPYAETDKMGYVYYANYLAYFERARNELMRDLGFTYKELEALNIGLPVIEAYARYHKPALYDDLLTIQGYVSEFKGLRIAITCKVYRGDTLLAEGYTKHAFIDLQNGKPSRIPDDVREKLQQLLIE